LRAETRWSDGRVDEATRLGDAMVRFRKWVLRPCLARPRRSGASSYLKWEFYSARRNMGLGVGAGDLLAVRCALCSLVSLFMSCSNRPVACV